MAESTRKTRLAVKEETVAGELLAPSSGNDFLAVRADLQLTPGVEELVSEELKSGLGASKTILGIENPEGTLSHYMYGSGTPGTPSEMDLLLKSAFGDSDVATTEYDVVSATAGDESNPATITVGVGEGAFFQRGQALLIKDATNGYSLRSIKSVAGDVLTLNFNLPAAPAAGTLLGLSTTYLPGESNFPSLSIFDYRGNGAVVSAISGARVSELAIEAAAGEFISCNFTLEGLEYFWDPVYIPATKYVDFTDDDGTFAASIASGWYKTVKHFAEAIKNAMDLANPLTPHYVTYLNSQGKYKFTAGGTVLSLLWNTGANTANTLATYVGFSAASDSTGNAASVGYTSATAVDLSAPYTPVLDGQDPLVAKGNEILIGNYSNIDCFCISEITATITNTLSPVLCACSESGQSEKVNGPREVVVELKASLNRYEADRFKNYIDNEEISFAWSFGPKSGGNWVEGLSGTFYLPSCTVSAISITDEDDKVFIEMSLKAFTATGEGEVYLAQV